MPQCAPLERSSALIGGQGPLIRAHGRWRIETRPDSAVEGACGRHAWEGSRRAAPATSCATWSSASRASPGSVLRKDGKDVWNVSGGALLNALRYARREHQRAEARGRPARRQTTSTGSRATSVIRDVHLIPGLWKIDGYTKLLRTSRRRSTSSAGENLFEFPYDWRRDNRVASRQLRDEDARLARRLAGSSPANRRREARARRPLDGRPRRAPLPRVPRGLARHAHARHVRHAVRRLAVRARHARQRQEDQVLRPDRDRALAHRALPAAADLPLLRRRRRQARARRPRRRSRTSTRRRRRRRSRSTTRSATRSSRT